MAASHWQELSATAANFRCKSQHKFWIYLGSPVTSTASAQDEKSIFSLKQMGPFCIRTAGDSLELELELSIKG